MTDQHDPLPKEKVIAYTPMTLTDTGRWVIAIPEPRRWRFYFECPGAGKTRCEARFWTKDGYRGHYALAHVLGIK